MMYYLKAIYLYPLLILMVILASAGAFITGIVISPFNKLTDKLLYLWGRIMLIIPGITLDVRGIENLEKIENGAVVIANHQSNFDIPIVFAAIPRRIRFMAKKSLFSIPLFGHALKAVGMIPIDREHREKAIKEMNKSLEYLNSNVYFTVFAEGTRSFDHNIQSFKKGGFVFAIKNGAPIVPVVISGSYEVMPRQSWIIKPLKVIVNILPVFETKGYTVRERSEAVNIVREQIVSQHEENLEELGYA